MGKIKAPTTGEERKNTMGKIKLSTTASATCKREQEHEGQGKAMNDGRKAPEHVSMERLVSSRFIKQRWTVARGQLWKPVRPLGG